MRAAVGLTRLELTALWALSAKPGLGVQALATELHVDHAVVSRLSKQLFRKEVARRGTDPQDRRRAPIELTAAGEEKAEAGRQMLKVANARIAEGFSDEEIAVVARFLEHLIEVGSETEPLSENKKNGFYPPLGFGKFLCLPFRKKISKAIFSCF